MIKLVSYSRFCFGLLNILFITFMGYVNFLFSITLLLVALLTLATEEMSLHTRFLLISICGLVCVSSYTVFLLPLSIFVLFYLLHVRKEVNLYTVSLVLVSNFAFISILFRQFLTSRQSNYVTTPGGDAYFVLFCLVLGCSSSILLYHQWKKGFHLLFKSLVILILSFSILGILLSIVTYMTNGVFGGYYAKKVSTVILLLVCSVPIERVLKSMRLTDRITSGKKIKRFLIKNVYVLLAYLACLMIAGISPVNLSTFFAQSLSSTTRALSAQQLFLPVIRGLVSVTQSQKIDNEGISALNRYLNCGSGARPVRIVFAGPNGNQLSVWRASYCQYWSTEFELLMQKSPVWSVENDSFQKYWSTHDVLVIGLRT